MEQGQWETEIGSKVQNNLFRGSRISQSYRNCENTLTRLRVQTRRYLLSLFETKVFAPEPRTCLILEFSFLLFSFFFGGLPLLPLFSHEHCQPPQSWPSAPSSLAWVGRGSLRDLAELLQVESGTGRVGGSSSLIRRRREMSSVLGLTSSLLGISQFPALGSQANN